MPYRSPLMSDEEYHEAVYIIGPWLLGGLIEMILFGILLAQFWSYYTFYGDDKIGNKIVVSGLGIVHVLKSAHTIATVWIGTILFFGDYEGSINLSYTKWWQAGFPLIDAACGLYVQIYYLYRLWVVCRLWYVVTVPSVILAFSFISIAIATNLIVHFEFTKIGTWFVCHFSTVFSVDILISGFTAYFLLKERKRVLQETYEVLLSLAKLSIQCAVPASICALLNLIFSQAYDAQDALISTAFNMQLPKLYAISMMYILNSRRSIIRAHGGSGSDSRSRTRKTTRITDVELSGVRVQTDTVTHHEVDVVDLRHRDDDGEVESRGGKNMEADMDMYAMKA